MEIEDKINNILESIDTVFHYEIANNSNIGDCNSSISKIAGHLNKLKQQSHLINTNFSTSINSAPAKNIGFITFDYLTGNQNISNVIKNLLEIDKSKNIDSFKSLIEFIIDDDRSNVFKLFIESLKKNTSTVFETEFRVKTNANQIKVIKVVWEHQTNSENKVVYTTASFADISEALTLNENLQKDYLDALKHKYALDESSIIAITNTHGIIEYVNDNFCKISKFNKDELIGKTHNIINSGYHKNEFFKGLWQTITRGKVWKGEIKNKAKDGTFYWVDTTIVPFLNNEKKPYQFLAIRVDITQRKLAEEALLLQNQQLEKCVNERTIALQETVNDLENKKSKLADSERFVGVVLNTLLSHIAVLNAYGEIILVNNAWLKFAKDNSGLLYQSGIVGSNYFDVCKNAIKSGDVYAEMALQGMKDVLEMKKSVFTLEYPCHSPNEERWFLMRVKKIEGSESMIVVSHTDITERKKADENLKSSLGFTKDLVDTLTVRVFWKDKKSRYLGCNKQFAADAGFESQDDIIGKTDFDLSWNAQAIKYVEDDLAVIETGESKTLIEETQTTFDGNTVTVLTTKVPLRNSNAEIVGVIGSYIDITERKQNEEKIRLSELKYRSLFEQASDAIFSTDFRGVILDVNESMCQMFGYKKENLIGKKIDCFIEPNNLRENPIKLKALEEGNHIFSERVMVHKDGTKLYIEANVKKIYDEKILVIVRDVTERKKAEEKILLHSNLLAAVDQSVIAADLIGNIIYWNKASENIYGWKEHEVMGKPVLDLLVTNAAMEKGKSILQNLIMGQSWAGEILLKNKKGVEFTTFASTTLIYDKANKPIGLIGVSFDLTERKKSEEALLKSESNLRAIFETEPECIKIVDGEGRLLEMNQSGLLMIEADNFEMVKGAISSELVIPEFRSGYKQHLKNVFKGQSEKYTFQIKGLKGTVRWMENNSVPMKDGKGNIVSILSVSRDVTDKINAEKVILESNERYNLVAKATNDSIWEYDIPTGKILRSGDGFKTLFGYDEIDINSESLHWKNLIHPDDIQKVLESQAQAFENRMEHNWKVEYRFLKANGQYAQVVDKGFIIRNDYGEPIKMIGATQDITERVNHINAIEEQNKKLKEIAWVQSHVVRAPLSRMMGIVSYLNEIEKNTEEFEEWVQHFKASALELDAIIHEIANKSDSIGAIDR